MVKGCNYSETRIKQGYPILPLFFNIILIVLARVIWQDREIQASNWKGRSKIISVYRKHLICIKPYRFHKKMLLVLLNKFIKVVGYKVTTQKSVAFLLIYTNNE